MILLAIYINVRGMDSYEVAQYMKQTQVIIKSMTHNMQEGPNGPSFIMIPVREQDTHIECIYPKFVAVDSPEIKEELLKYDESMKQLAEYIKENLPKITAKIS